MSKEGRKEIPKGYAWKEMSSINAKFPMPSTWFFKETHASGTFGYFITRERISGVPFLTESQGISLVTTTPDKFYKTGLSVNVFSHVDLRFGVLPSQMAQGIMQSQPDFMLPEDPVNVLRYGPLHTFRRHFKTEKGEIMGIQAEPTNYYMELTGNNATGTLYMIMFESPSREWQQDKGIAKVMVEKRVLDTRV